jgi:hypothetical protein
LDELVVKLFLAKELLNGGHLGVEIASLPDFLAYLLL